MSIRIVPKDQLGKQREKGTTAGNIPPLLFANLKSLYTRRTERLQQLALDNPLADYLDFAAKITEAQQKALHDHPLVLDMQAELVQSAASGKPLGRECFSAYRTLAQAAIRADCRIASRCSRPHFGGAG